MILRVNSMYKDDAEPSEHLIVSLLWNAVYKSETRTLVGRNRSRWPSNKKSIPRVIELSIHVLADWKRTKDFYLLDVEI